MPEGRGSLASILERRGVGFRGVARVQCFVAEIRRKILTDDATVENEGLGSTPVPGCGARRPRRAQSAHRFDEVTIIIDKPLRRLRPHGSRCWPAGTPANYTRGRVCSPSLRDRGFSLKMTLHHEFSERQRREKRSGHRMRPYVDSDL